MQQVPDHLDADVVCGVNKWIDGREVVRALDALNEVPPDAVAHGIDSHTA